MILRVGFVGLLLGGGWRFCVWILKGCEVSVAGKEMNGGFNHFGIEKMEEKWVWRMEEN